MVFNFDFKTLESKYEQYTSLYMLYTDELKQYFCITIRVLNSDCIFILKKLLNHSI
jgi:hypothetical protein